MTKRMNIMTKYETLARLLTNSYINLDSHKRIMHKAMNAVINNIKKIQSHFINSEELLHLATNKGKKRKNKVTK